VLTRATPDGVVENVFAAPPSTAKPNGVERIVTISGASLASIAAEIAGASPEDVDRKMAV
jgi:hypothetical protein